MKKVYEYSHLGGSEILKVTYPSINNEIDAVIKSIIKVSKTKVSKEKTMKGKKLFSPVQLNKFFKSAFHKKGFTELKDRYDITIPNSTIKISGAFKQVDFVKDKVLIEVLHSTGKCTTQGFARCGII